MGILCMNVSVCVCVCVIGVNLLFQIECYLIMNVIARMNSFLIFSKPQDKPRFFFIHAFNINTYIFFGRGWRGEMKEGVERGGGGGGGGGER